MAEPNDAVWLQKYEDTATGGDDADQADAFAATEPLDPHDDAPMVQGIFLIAPQPSTTLDKLVFITRDASGNIVIRDDVDQTERTLTDLLSGGSGVTPGSHRNLDQLVHAIAETSFEEVSYTGNKVDSIIVWTTVGKTQKIREELFTYTGNQVTTIVTKQYDAAGTLIVGETMTETLSYTGNKLDDITRVMS